ncbi:MAG TPA: hypothetical protein VNF04_19070 [Stellaceae bacterium]|nr:hypothetical protein [Stellaceae bacterium]
MDAGLRERQRHTPHPLERLFASRQWGRLPGARRRDNLMDWQESPAPRAGQPDASREMAGISAAPSPCYTMLVRCGRQRDVTGHMTDPIIIAGHSHVGALIGRATKGDCFLQPVEGHERIFGLQGPFPRTLNYWRALKRFAPGHSIALLWGGNQHNTLFLVEQPLRFDLLPRALQSLPVDEDAVIVPETLVRAKFRTLLGDRHEGGLHDLFTDLKAQTRSRIALVGTPPPPVSNSHRQVGLTPPAIRLKLWHVLKEIYQEEAERYGVEFIAIPDNVTDESGFLKQEFWTEDVTHANPAYGRVMLDRLAQEL